MLRFFLWISIAFALGGHASVNACDATIPCDKCVAESEMSWNPENRFVTGRLQRFYSLDDLIGKAYAAGDFAAVSNLTAEYLALAAVYRCNWNYGNAIHDANRFLGLVSVKHGDVELASQYLLKAGKSTGSPQLDTFGPELDLANELLKQGAVEPVKEYLRDIKRFWRLDQGQVAKWLASIDKGERPELNRFAAMQPGAAQIALFWLVLAWPVLVVAGVLYLLKSQILRKLTFGALGLLCGYLALAIANVGLGYLAPRILEIENLGATTLTYMAAGAGLLIPLLAIVGVSRLFVTRDAS